MSSTFYLYLGDECHILEEILFSSQKKIRKKFKSLFDFSLDVIYVHDLKGNFLDANDIALKTLGYTKEEILKLSFKDLMDKDQARLAFNRTYQVVEKEKPTKLTEFKLKTKVGNFVYLKSSGIPLKENGKVYAVLCIAKDITEYKKVEQRLKESEDKYQIISENANDLILILNNKLKFEYINEPPLFKIFGYSINDVMNTNLLKVIHPDDLERFLREFNESFEGIEGTVEVRVKHKDGHYIWTESDGNVFTDKDREQKLFIILRDITKRKEGEKKLRESEEKYRLISENANDLISILNKNFKLEYLNEKSILKASGFTKEELISKSVLDFIHPNDLKQFLNKFREVFKTGEGVIDVRTRRKDGTYRWFETRGSTFIDNNGEVKYLLVSRDITERKIAEKKLKKSEEKLRKLNKELEQRIEERTKKLKESEKRYRDFTSIASHEFKTPLIPIIGIPQLLVKDNNLTEQQKDSLNEILHSGKKLNELIDNLLDTSQIERKSVKLSKREIEINPLIDWCISDLSFLIKQKNHKLIKDMQEDIKLNIDDKKISRVLTNLVSNAIKFTPSNGKIEISTQIDDENNFIFSIKDNGIGIEEKDQELIFQKFGKIRGEEIVKYELDSHGSGLGLFISKEIIKLHGGEMWFESAGKNNGTTFYFKLPRK